MKEATTRAKTPILLVLAALVPAVTPASAHNALISCYDNGDETVTCEAGYSDGASAAGQVIRVLQANKRLILEDKFKKDGTYTFKKPSVAFYIEFIGDPSHQATFDGDDLAK
jgi:hypothetical protein